MGNISLGNQSPRWEIDIKNRNATVMNWTDNELIQDRISVKNPCECYAELSCRIRNVLGLLFRYNLFY